MNIEVAWMDGIVRGEGQRYLVVLDGSRVLNSDFVLSPGNCHCGKPGRWRRQNTMYVNDIQNWERTCDECQEELDEYWADMWDEYWSMVL